MSNPERLVHGILSSLTAALTLVVDGREHHALCTRSFDMVRMYEEEWFIFHAAKWESYDDKAKQAHAKWYQWVKLTADSARKQKQGEFQDVIARSVIFLADVLENITESFLQVCLLYIDNEVLPIREVTGRKPRNLKSASDIRKSVRAWERSLSHSSRLARFTAMIRTFFPTFILDDKKQLNLDALIKARNALTHELIIVSPTHRIGEPPLKRPTATEEQVQSYFDDVGQYIIALMEAFKDTQVRPGPDQPTR